MELRLCFTFKLIFLCCLNVVVFGCRGLPTGQHIGNITSDLAIEVGSPLEIICSLYKHHIEFSGANYSVNSSDLILKKGKVLKNVVILDESSIAWKLPHGKVNDTGSYQCLVEIPHVSKPLAVVCRTHVEVGYKPLPALNFSCESINFSNLTCQWTVPPNPVKTDYILKRNLGFLSVGCPEETVTASSCWWSLYTKPLYQQASEKLSFVLIGKNSLGVNTQYFSLSHSKIVRPGPPSFSVRVHKNNATLIFRRPSAMEHLPLRILLQYQLCYTVGNSSEVCKTFEDQHRVEVEMELIPFQEYNFKLRCKSRDAENDMWGPFSKLQSVKTQADVPYLAPATASSLFHSEVVGNSRVVTVYWEEVPKINHNGPNFCYRLSYYPCKNNMIKKEIMECQRNYLQIKNLAVNECYTFRVCPINDVGTSSNCSYINIEEASKLLPSLGTVTAVHSDKNFCSLSWEPPLSDTPEIYNYTVLWCETDFSPSPDCSGPVHWFYTKNTVAQLTGLGQDRAYSFSVSVNSGDLTSGVNLVTCILQLNSSLQGGFSRIPSVFLTKMSTSVIEINWYSNACTPRNFKTLNVTYCEIESPDKSCVGEMKYLNITHSDLDGIVIKGLQPKTNYRAVVSALTREGWHVESEPLYYEFTYADDFALLPIVFTTVGVVLVCVGVIGTIVTGARRLKHRIDQERSTVIKLPDGLDPEMQYEHLTTASVKKSVSSENPSFKSFQVVESGYFEDMTPDASLIIKSSDGENKTDSSKTSSQDSDFGLSVLSAENYCRPKSSNLPCSENSPYLKVAELILESTSTDHLTPLVSECEEHHSKSPYVAFDELPTNSCNRNVASMHVPQSSTSDKLYSDSDHYSRCGLKRNMTGDPIDVTKRSASFGNLGLFKSQNPYISLSFAANLNEDPVKHNYKQCSNDKYTMYKMPSSGPGEFLGVENSEDSSCTSPSPANCPASSKFSSPYVTVSHLLESTSKSMGDGVP